MTTMQQIKEMSIQEQIRQAIRPLLGSGIDTWDEHALLQDMGQIHYDSVTVMECVLVLEQTFRISIDFIEDDLSHTFQSIATMQSLVEKKLADLALLER